MTSRERVLRTLEHKEVDRVPRQLWTLPYLKADLNKYYKEFPDDFTGPVFSYGKMPCEKGVYFMPPSYVDDWGCEWNVLEDGVTGEVKNPPLADFSKINTLMPPTEALINADWSHVNESCNTDKFVLAGTKARPYERLQFIRGTENVLMDLAYGDSRIYKLIEIIHEYNCKEIEMWANTDVDGISFMDDWGSQNSLLISPKMWKEIFKPLYKDYCDIIKSKGKKVFMHSDGYIMAIYPELIEIGVDAINSQLFCMNIEEIAEKYKGKITFWGEIDRQYLLSQGTTEECREAVRRVKKALGKTGVIAEAEWGHDAKEENIYAIYDEWNK